MKFIAMLLATIVASQSLACETPTKVVKGQPSPCDGYVFNPQLEEKIRTDLQAKDLEIDYLIKEKSLQKDIMLIDEQQLKLYRDQLNAEHKDEFWQKTLYFVLGSTLTGLVAYGTVQAIK